MVYLNCSYTTIKQSSIYAMIKLKEYFDLHKVGAPANMYMSIQEHLYIYHKLDQYVGLFLYWGGRGQSISLLQ